VPAQGIADTSGAMTVETCRSSSDCPVAVDRDGRTTRTPTKGRQNAVGNGFPDDAHVLRIGFLEVLSDYVHHVTRVTIADRLRGVVNVGVPRKRTPAAPAIRERRVALHATFAVVVTHHRLRLSYSAFIRSHNSPPHEYVRIPISFGGSKTALVSHQHDVGTVPARADRFSDGARAYSYALTPHPEWRCDESESGRS